MLRNSDSNGDLWNICHFWSNFEIADLDFYRLKAYRDLFAYLDKEGGFYHERWGDAAVHSLAAAMLLKPEELHHFSDLGYIHDGLQYCTSRSMSMKEEDHAGYAMPFGFGKTRRDKSNAGQEVGCRCECDPDVRVVEPFCLNRINMAMG